MQEVGEEFYQIQGELPYSYYFAYKDKKYPFILDLFKGYSNYFLQNETEIDQSKIIRLIDEHEEQILKINDDIINTFIKFVHRERICISKENVSTLNYLGRKYSITQLIEVTTDFINKHQKELVVDLLLIHQYDMLSETTTTYENILSNNLLDHINDERLLQLSFPILYRILSKYEENKSEENENEKEREKIFEFYFKCLDKFGRESSILFKNVDFKYLKSDYLNLLMTKYSKIFDFHFINSEYLKSIYDEQNSLFL